MPYTKNELEAQLRDQAHIDKLCAEVDAKLLSDYRPGGYVCVHVEDYNQVVVRAVMEIYGAENTGWTVSQDSSQWDGRWIKLQ